MIRYSVAVCLGVILAMAGLLITKVGDATAAEDGLDVGFGTGVGQPAETPTDADAEAPDETPADAGALEPGPVPGEEKPFPNLGDVPERPEPSSAEERKVLEEGLIADRERRAYSDEAVSLQGEATSPLPPPSPVADVPAQTSPSAQAGLEAVPEAKTDAVSGTVSESVSETTTGVSPTESAGEGTSTATASSAAPPFAGTAPPPAVVPSPEMPAEAPSQASAPPPPAPAAQIEPVSASSSAREPSAVVSAPDATPPPASPSPPSPTASPTAVSPAEAGTSTATSDGDGRFPPPPTALASSPSSSPSPADSGGPSARPPADQGDEMAKARPLPATPAAPPPAASDPLVTVVVSSEGVVAQPDQPVFAPAPPAAPAVLDRAPPAAPEQVAVAPPRSSLDSAPSSGRSVRVATILFADGSAALGGREREIIERVVDVYRQRGGNVRVVGHASQRTRSMDLNEHRMVNYEVSLQRAMAVAHELERRGVPKERIVITALGDEQPVFYEVMETGEAGNRRAEIFIDY